MAGATEYPAALDAFPTIDANTSEAAPGVEHDVVHANVHAALAALQIKVGVDGSVDGDSIDAKLAALSGQAGQIDAVAAQADALDTQVVALDGQVAAIDARVGEVEADIELLADAQLAHAADIHAHAHAAVALAVVAGAVVLDCDDGRFFTLALGSNAALSITHPPAADCLLLRVVPSAGAVLTLPGNCTLLSGAAYVGGSAPHVLGFITFDGGTSFGVVVAKP